jgi:hypothetical protein
VYVCFWSISVLHFTCLDRNGLSGITITSKAIVNFRLAAMFLYYIIQKVHFIRSFSMCRLRQFLAVHRSFFHSSLLCTFPATLLHQLFIHPLSPHLAVYFLVCLSILLFSYSYIILFWEFYFLPFSEHAQTNLIYYYLRFFNSCMNFFIG